MLEVWSTALKTVLQEEDPSVDSKCQVVVFSWTLTGRELLVYFMEEEPSLAILILDYYLDLFLVLFGTNNTKFFVIARLEFI